MNVTITGASGFLGTRLLQKLQSGGHKVHVLGRKPIQGLPFSRWDSTTAEPPPASLSGADAVVHLAGEPVAQRWTPQVKQRIRASRIDGTRNLVHALSTLSRRPGVLVSASAIGIYGSRGDEILTETSTAGEGFLADLTKQWEFESSLAESLGIRVAQVRIGVVLGLGGGALAKMLPPFRAGIGGPLGSGKQWMSWIHVDDLVDLLLFAIQEKPARGPLNGTAPDPVTNALFAKELAAVLHRPAIMRVPAFALKMLLGEMASVVLASQRALPKATEAAGFKFQHPHLTGALHHLLG